MRSAAHAKVFWSGGSQAVRLPKEFRLEGTEVLVHRRGKTLVLEPLAQGTDWTGFWENLVPLNQPLVRRKSRSAEKRRPV